MKYYILSGIIVFCMEGASQTPQSSHFQLGHNECSYASTNCHTTTRSGESQLLVTYDRLYDALRSSNRRVAPSLMVQWPPHSGKQERIVLSAYYKPPGGGHPNEACYYLVEQNENSEWGWIDDSPPFKNKWRPFNEYLSPPED